MLKTVVNNEPLVNNSKMLKTVVKNELQVNNSKQKFLEF